MPYNVEDITLEYLEEANRISVRTINICRKNRLNGLNDIIFFYKTNGSFKNLDNCGEKTEKELIEICKDFNQLKNERTNKINENDGLKYFIEKLNPDNIEAINKHIEFLISDLSIRARNGILGLFHGMPQIHQFLNKIYSSSFSFHSIRNIGVKTASELDHLKEEFLIFIEKYNSQENERDENQSGISITVFKPAYTLVDIFNEFNPFKKSALNRHIEFLISNLKIRARNGITQFFGDTFTAKEIIEKIYSNSFDFQNIQNIGSKTVLELNNFKRDVSSFIETLRFIEDDQLSREYAKLIVKTTFTDLPVNFNEQFENVFDNTGKLHLFKLIHFLLEDGHLLKQKEKELFYFLYTETCTKSLEQIATELDLGKERLRQIRIAFEGEIQDYFRFTLSFNSQDLVPYNISTDTYFKIIDKEFVQKINTVEDVKFNVLFYSIIFGLFLENSHSVLGDDETIAGKGNYSKTIHYKNCYIINNIIFHSFDFNTFTNDVNINLSNRITETYALHFEGYLLQFIKKEGKQYLSNIKQTCEAIIFNEFDLVVNNEGYLVFERNIKKTVQDYVIEILQDLDEMTKIEAITQAINEKYPGLRIIEQSVRSTLHREKELFIYIGRTSTYGLRKWQNERDNLKGGTIRNIVEEFLKPKLNPAHISEIMKYVLKFRSTNVLNVLGNIKLEENNRFQIFPGEFIGLKEKHYLNIEKYKKVSGSHFRISVFKNMDGWDFNDVVNYFVSNYNYNRIQVKAIIEKKIASGEFSLTSNNKLKR